MRIGERYAERMSLPVSAWLGVAVLAIFAALLSNFGDFRWWRISASVVVLIVPLVGAWWLGRLPVGVADADGDTWLHVDDAKLPMSAVAEVRILERESYSDALGVALHPLAFVVQRPWIGQGIQLILDDPDDPTPCWIVSSRNPERLRDALLEKIPAEA